MAAVTITATTLTAAVGLTDDSIGVTSITTPPFVRGNVVVIDGEAMTVKSSWDTTSLRVPVSRGQLGTRTATHGSSALVYCCLPQLVSSFPPAVGSTVTGTDQAALPRIVIDFANGVRLFDAMGASSTTQTWQLVSTNGVPTSGPPQALGAHSPVIYTSSGAITPQPGAVGINGSTLAMTIIDPTRAQDGMRMFIYAVNASAHTLTYTAGFGGGTTARDVGTFGGAVNDGLVIWANAGTWFVESTRNVTLG